MSNPSSEIKKETPKNIINSNLTIWIKLNVSISSSFFIKWVSHAGKTGFSQTWDQEHELNKLVFPQLFYIVTIVTTD